MGRVMRKLEKIKIKIDGSEDAFCLNMDRLWFFNYYYYHILYNLFLLFLFGDSIFSFLFIDIFIPTANIFIVCMFCKFVCFFVCEWNKDCVQLYALSVVLICVVFFTFVVSPILIILFWCVCVCVFLYFCIL